jgi:membrane protease YdiL (CAAX protease family)
MPSEPRTRHQLYHAEALAPLAATKVLGAAIGAIYALQIGLYSLGMIELAASVLADVAVLAGLAVYARRRGLRFAHFGLRKARWTYVAAAMLIGVSAWYVTLYFVTLINPPGDTSQLQEIVEQAPFVATIGAIAVLPAIVEEIVFRGVFARALTMQLVPIAAIVISSVAFGVFHLIPAQMISTFLLGLALAYLTLRADSVLPAIIAHLLNNVIALLLSRDELPALSNWIASHPGITSLIACASVAAGLLLARGSRRE